MVLQFDKPGTCLIVRQYLDRSRCTVRRELMDRFYSLMEQDSAKDRAKIQPLEDCPEAQEQESTQTDKAVVGAVLNTS